MGLKCFRAGLPKPSFIAFAGILTLTGCSADRYFMVPKTDLNELQGSVKSQRATLVTMEENAATRHEQAVAQTRSSTQTILDAIATQVEKPECPPVQVQKQCPADRKSVV